MIRVAIVGANGFIGGRTVELFYLNRLVEVRPVVRNYAGLARLARFELDCRIADAFDQTGLTAALTGCDVVIHAVAGDPTVILGTLSPVYRAAEAAGVRRLVYLSTATVHGQAPAPGVTEASPLSDRQPLAYNNAKVRAEQHLHALRSQGSVELALLRPGIVTGPRSSWVANFADALLAGTAYLVDRGQGVCNSIYIDNLVYAIYLALNAPAADGQAFLLGDRERVTWADLYGSIATALGYDLDQLPEAEVPNFRPGWRQHLQSVHQARPTQMFLSLFPQALRQAGFDMLTGLLAKPTSPWALPTPPRPIATEEMALLYRCQYKMPFDKARERLGYEPVVSFAEACRRTVGWLRFAGYPVVEPDAGCGA